VDNITLDTPKTWSNLEVFLDAWRAHRASTGVPSQ